MSLDPALLVVPADFNCAYDVVGRRGDAPQKLAIRWVGLAGESAQLKASGSATVMLHGEEAAA